MFIYKVIQIFIELFISTHLIVQYSLFIISSILGVYKGLSINKRKIYILWAKGLNNFFYIFCNDSLLFQCIALASPFHFIDDENHFFAPSLFDSQMAKVATNTVIESFIGYDKN